MTNLLKENEIIQFWNKINAFQLSLESTKEYPKFIFYDGPPFATGLPHYGHIVASTLKDIIPRYKSQNGYHVERVFGWDTHGLPIEYEIEKLLGIKTKQEVLDYGIENYNEECRKIVLKFRSEWRETIERLGRWVDFDNDYKTMDTSFMESVWWVLSELFKKNLVYRGVKVMPYSNGCTTTLSHSEATSNYKNVSDPSLTIKIKVNLEDETTNTYLLVWTTTPWTLVSNLGLCVNPELEYNLILSKKENEYYVLAKECIPKYFKVDSYQLIKSFSGKELLGIKYQPIYPYFEKEYDAFRVLNDNYVKSNSGTGIVHIAPAFGDDDYRVCFENKIISKEKIPPCPLDANGHFINKIEQFEGIYIKDADKLILKDLKERKIIFKYNSENHEYPFCWRSNTPLIYKSVPSWFIKVEEFKDKIVDNNLQTSWTPKQIRDNKFGSWLKNSIDWNFSRSRYWGTPIPIWTNEDYTEIVCIGSIQELETLAELPRGSIKDLHRHHIDHITIKSKSGQILKRIPEVFDCWFESGSMPYGQKGYPFNHKTMDDIFPADFIAEGTDQTRGWFYSLMVLSTALFDKPAFKNVIVNGLVLASDGEKMSKSKKNYPPVNNVFEKYGADAVRLYLIGSPVVRAGNLKFKESDIRTINKNIVLKFHDIIKYLMLMISIYEDKFEIKFKPKNVFEIDIEPLDLWFLEYTNQFIKEIHHDMDNYDLYNIGNIIDKLIDNLSRGYINLDKIRRNLYDSGSKEKEENSLSVFFYCLYHITVTLAPFIPFITESIYQQLKKYKLGVESVHLIQMEKEIWKGKSNLISCMESLIKINDITRVVRTKIMKRGFRMPIYKIIVINKNENKLLELQNLDGLIYDVLNVLDIEYDDNEEKYVDYSLKIKSELGKHYKRDMKILNKYLSTLNSDKINSILKDNNSLNINQMEIPLDHLEINKKLLDNENYISYIEDDFIILMDDRITEEMKIIQDTKLLIRFLQDFRKECNLVHTDKINIYYEVLENKENNLEKILSNTEKNLGISFKKLNQENKFKEKKYETDNLKIIFQYELL